MGYSLQANRKTKEGQHHADRDAQFEYISRQVRAFQEDDQPAISVDAKKKENIGIFAIPGGVASPSQAGGGPCQRFFWTSGWVRPIPEGVYDLSRNEGWVSVGVDHDTAEFAGVSIRRWWEEMGSLVYPGARRLLITADAGGSNGYRPRLWKVVLQGLANDLGLRICGLLFPAGHEQVEQDRAPHVLLHHEELAWQAASLASRHRQLDRRHDDEGGIADPSGVGIPTSTGLASGFPMNNSPKYNCRELHSTVNGTTQ